MKVAFLCVLAAIAIGCSSAAVVVPNTRANFIVGSISYGDKLLHRQVMYRQAISGAAQTEDYIFRGNGTTWISAVQATEVGYSQYGSVYVLAGGVGQNNITLRVQSAVSYGYYFIIDVYGR